MTGESPKLGQPKIIRVLLHPRQDERLLDQVVGIIETACENDPSHWQHVRDRLSVIDHYAYYTPLLAAVILAKESDASMYYRLTIRPGEHPVFDLLAAVIIEALQH